MQDTKQKLWPKYYFGIGNRRSCTRKRRRCATSTSQEWELLTNSKAVAGTRTRQQTVLFNIVRKAGRQKERQAGRQPQAGIANALLRVVQVVEGAWALSLPTAHCQVSSVCNTFST